MGIKSTSNNITQFGTYLSLNQMEKAAKLYTDLAYMYQKEFNQLLDVYDAKETVFEIMRNLEGYGEYVDQI